MSSYQPWWTGPDANTNKPVGWTEARPMFAQQERGQQPEQQVNNQQMQQIQMNNAQGGGNLGFGGGFASAQQMQQPNPYLGAQAQAIANVSNRNLQNIVLPGVNSGAMAAGGFGGSRHGIAQGLAIQGQQQSLNDSLANLYGNAYTQDRNLANQYDIANMQNSTTQRGQDLNYQLGQAGLSQQRYATDVGAATSRYGTDVGAQTAARGQDLTYSLGQQQNALGYAGLQNQYNIANAGNATQIQVAGMNNATQTGIANMQNATTLNGQNLNYNLGLTQNNTTQRGQDMNYGLGMAQNATTLNGQNLNYQVGMANANNSANSNLMNFYTNNRQLDQSGTRLGMDMVTAANLGYLGQGQGLYNLGLTAGNQAWSPYTNFSGAASQYTGFGTTTNSNNGNAGAGFLGGAIAGGQLYNLFNQPAKQGA